MTDNKIKPLLETTDVSEVFGGLIGLIGAGKTFNLT